MKKVSKQILETTLAVVFIMAILLTIPLFVKSKESTTTLDIKPPCMMPTYGVGYANTLTLLQIKTIINEVAACRLGSRMYSYENVYKVHPRMKVKVP